MKQRVVIIGHGYTSRLSLIRSLAELGCEITVVVTVLRGWLGRMVHFEGGKPVDCCSKYVSRYLYGSGQDEEKLIALLLEKCACHGQKTILIPDSDFSAAAVDRYQERLAADFLFPHIGHTPGAVEHWMHKTVQKALAAEVGLPVTGDCTVQIRSGRYEMPAAVRYSCFTKPLATISGGKGYLRRCDDEASLRRVLDAVAREIPNTDVLVEDYKTIAKEYAVVGFSDGENVVIPGVIEFVENSRSHVGIARQGLIRPVAGFEAILSRFSEFVRRVGFYGLFDIDFWESGGVLYFDEMNLRFGGSGYAYTAAGANLPALFVRSLTGAPLSPPMVTTTASFVNERMVIEDWNFLFLSTSEKRQIFRNADIHFVFDERDPGPQRRLRRYQWQIGIKRTLRKWKHWIARR